MVHVKRKRQIIMQSVGESGDIEPGKSLVFAALEACMCVITKQIPVLNPSAPSTGFQVP
jgi:hypothetical protein